MYEYCIENFLKTSDPTRVERHSDSSDFENENKIPIVSPKHGNHSLFLDKSCLIKPEKDINSYNTCNKNAYNNIKIKCDENKLPLKRYRKKLSSMNHNESVPKPQSNLINMSTKNNYKNRGDQSSIHLIEKSYSKSIIRNKVMPCLSTIFRRSHNGTKHMDCIEEDCANNINNCDRYCPNHKRQKSNKNTRGRKGYSVQPVYVVKENIHGFRYPNTIQQVSATKVRSIRNEDYELSYNNSSIYSVSDNEPVRKDKHKNIVKEVKQRLEKEMRNYYCKQANSRNEQQQFPSKSHLKSPYQILTSSSCQAKCASFESNGFNRIPSSSSAFWDFLAGKIKFQVEKAEVVKAEVVKPCQCIKPIAPCSPTTCEYKISKDTVNISNPSLLPKVPSCCRLSEKPSSASSSSNKKQAQEDKVICKCHKNKKEGKKRKKGSKNINAQSMTQEDTKPCQEQHNDITSAIAQKYNGEILCIHNPPCVLINGCLNLPPLKADGPGNFFPVTQTKKSSFSQMYRRIKGSKEKKSEVEQASQYHPPYAELQQYLPEFGTEKIIQSVCNHNPPCEIVRGCYKPKYNPKLHNSCIHVPSCNKLPECLLERTTMFQNNTCVHKPKCEELPLCSRKYIVLTAKEDVGTQVKPKSKMLCRHEPPCFMIPKCLARAICSDYIPIGAIPGCVHQPSCEMIPACCRKSAKEMVSVPSQYPNKSCRIV